MGKKRTAAQAAADEAPAAPAAAAPFDAELDSIFSSALTSAPALASNFQASSSNEKSHKSKKDKKEKKEAGKKERRQSKKEAVAAAAAAPVAEEEPEAASDGEEEEGEGDAELETDSDELPDEDDEEILAALQGLSDEDDEVEPAADEDEAEAEDEDEEGEFEMEADEDEDEDDSDEEVNARISGPSMDIDSLVQETLGGGSGDEAPAAEQAARSDEELASDEEEGDDNDEDEEEAGEVGSSRTQKKAPKSAKKTAPLTPAEQAEQDKRTIFVGNVPIEAVKSRVSLAAFICSRYFNLKIASLTTYLVSLDHTSPHIQPLRRALKTHLAQQLPGLSSKALDTIRFRSIPLSAPTMPAAMSEARSAAEAAAVEKKMARSLQHRELLAKGEAEERGLPASAIKFLNPSEKRKVRFIKQEINENASSVHCYITVSKDFGLPPKSAGGEQQLSLTTPTAASPARIVAAALAAAADSTLFEKHHLRVDLVTMLTTEEVAQALSMLRSAGSASSSGASDKGKAKAQAAADGAAGIYGLELGAARLGELLQEAAEGGAHDNKRTLFVGGLDFTASEEDVRAFFEGLVAEERGAPSNESSSSSSTAGSSVRTWVRSVRIVRDRATQMGKGIAYVRFVDEACVDEIIAISEAEQAFFSAAEAAAHGGKGRAAAAAAAAGTQGGKFKKTITDENGKRVEFKRRLKFMKRPIRVSRCKAKTKSAFSSMRGSTSSRINSSGSGSSNDNANSSPLGARGDRSLHQTPAQRRRSSGAPTPGGTSPSPWNGAGNKRGANGGGGGAGPNGSPVSNKRARYFASNDGGAPASSSPLRRQDRTTEEYKSLDKSTRVALKKGDAERQARRAEKKERKKVAERAVRKAGAGARGSGGGGGGSGRGEGSGGAMEKVKLRQPGKKSKPGMGKKAQGQTGKKAGKEPKKRSSASA